MSNNDWDVQGSSLRLPFGGTTDYVLITADPSEIPADLIAHYAAFNETIVAAFLFFGSGATPPYSYILFTIDLTPKPWVAFGGRDAGGTIKEAYRYISLGGVAETAFGLRENPSLIAMFGASQLTFFDNSQLFLAGAATVLQASGQTFLAGSVLSINSTTWLVDNIEYGRGLKAYVDSIAATAAIGAEAVVLTGPVMDFEDGRCYEVEWGGNVFGSAGAPGAFAFNRIRLTNLAGAIKAFTQVHLPAAGAQNYVFGKIRVRRAIGAGILTTNLVLTSQATAGTVTWSGAATDVRYLTVKDCGAGADYGNAITV